MQHMKQDQVRSTPYQPNQRLEAARRDVKHEEKQSRSKYVVFDTILGKLRIRRDVYEEIFGSEEN